MFKKTIIIGLILSLYYLLIAEQEPFPIFFRSKGNITVDGSNKDWPAVYPCIMESDSQIKRANRDTPEEYGVKIYTIFDSNNMYIYGEFIDSTPLLCRYLENNIYQGDCLEIYLGLREAMSVAFGPNDFQIGVGLSRRDQLATWIWNKSRELKDHEIKIVKTDKGYNLEARIPLKNFGKESVKDGDTVWLDFAVDNSKGEGMRNAQLVWNGDGEGWKTPKVWRKTKLFGDINEFKKPRVLTPPNVTTKSYNRIYFYYNGKPFIGNVKIGKKMYNTDKKGGVTLILDEVDKDFSYSFNYGSGTYEYSSNVDLSKRRNYIVMPIKEIKVNQLGYSNNEEKIFIFTSNDNQKSNEFQIIRKSDNKEVYKGTFTGPTTDIATGDINYYGDFSGFKDSGEYFIKIDKFESYVFKIDENIFKELLTVLTRSYYLTRCDMAINDEKISGVKYPACHLNDGYFIQDVLNNVPKEKWRKKDVTGGWHDAGDYGKYISSAGLTCTQLLLIYELFPAKFSKLNLNIPESNNNFPDFLDEIKYELDWMLKMQDEKTGGIYHKVITFNFPGSVTPDQDSDDRLINVVTTSATGIFVGTMLTAYRVFKDADPQYAEKLKKAALIAGKFLLKNKSKTFDPVIDNTGQYKTFNGVADELFWAFAEIYKITGDKKYYKAASLFIGREFDWSGIIGWDNVHALGMLALYNNKKISKDVKDKILAKIRLTSDSWAEKILNDGYRVALSQGEYYWGSNKNACAKAMHLIMAYLILKNENYKRAARYQIDYILGVNTLSKSFITKVGTDYVRYPHHRYFQATDINIPGLLIAGPNSTADDGTFRKGQGPKGYLDQDLSFSCNENAIDYAAPLIFLAGYFMKDSADDVFKAKKESFKINKALSTVLLIILAFIIVLIIVGIAILITKRKKKE